MTLLNVHKFHIPVMGLGFSIDTPVKVAKYGISSVISLVEDILMEKMREYYCKKINEPFIFITQKEEDYRAKRITSYLNLINKIVKKEFEDLKKSAFEKGSEITKYFEMLPDASTLKRKFNQMLQSKEDKTIRQLQVWLKNNIHPGMIDVNIMTKLDKVNYKNNEELPIEYNDAHAALRGYALSDLNSSIIFSAGMSPRLYSYIENFKDFYPDKNGQLKKRIILKVSDYRSALIQGKFLAKKGLWVSEYRIESGLNCGGHAFATDGYLLGPILEEFKRKKEELINTTRELFVDALKSKNNPFYDSPLSMNITVQGGIGTSEEQNFLFKHYDVQSAGWATPFLLVPEVANVDETTLQLLKHSREEDLYLSNISPLGIPFNSLKGNTKDIEKKKKIEKGIPGSSCPKKYLVSNKEFTTQSICIASRQYQNKKIAEIKKDFFSQNEIKKALDKVVDRSCICVGLGTPALLVNNLSTKVEGEGVSVCPGPNMAYFSKIVSLKEMVDHIYGRINLLNEQYRPNIFIKELGVYVDYLKDKINENIKPLNDKQIKYFNTFKKNLLDGIEYYKNRLLELTEESSHSIEKLKEELYHFEELLKHLNQLINPHSILLESRVETTSC